MAPRVTTRGPTALRTSSADSDPSHHRSPKVADRRSPRSANSEPLSQKKLGTRIAGLETQLEHAQGELKILKNQLASAEAAKKEAQKELEKRTTKVARSEPAPVPVPVHNIVEPEPVLIKDQVPVQDVFKPEQIPVPNQNAPGSELVSMKGLAPVQDILGPELETLDDSLEETDVFEVPIEMGSVESKTGGSEKVDQKWVNVKVNALSELPEKAPFEEAVVAKNEEISVLKIMIEEKEQKLVAFSEENERLKRDLSEANAKISSALVKEEKMNLSLARVEEEMKKSKNNELELKKKLQKVEAAKDGLELEMKKLRVQTEQWRKAADAAASILSGEVERCGSMDKNFGGVFDGYGRFTGSPGLGDESDDGFATGNGKRKGTGIRMFGDLWKKKGQK